MRIFLHFAAIVALLATTPALRGQITDPNILVSGPPQPPHTRRSPRIPRTGNLQWLWQYAQPEPNGNAVALRVDERFATLLSNNFRQPQAFWGDRTPLPVLIPRFLARYSEVNTKANRYFMVDGCVPSFCAAHGMLWADLGAPEPLLIFAAVNWTTEGHTVDEANADYDLWLFTSRHLSADTLPLTLRESLADWDVRLAAAHRGVPHIVHAVLVEPDGQPFPLNPTLAGANTVPPQADTLTPNPDSR